ncbi:hypothetical protein [Herpetosiphon geysericola]|uniref:Uncharacterized protein n=1 Tax=Herpetosiphon geysericola TaxID=70996 RepID=A0A0P6YDN0_9CHLR|nr:hypothetical protein [Herpetosiphon geysericola]KPL90192.1 hypothetical protein SE18_08280 [Herpetosiphon geysericola]
MSYQVPPAHGVAANGRRSGCLCMLGVISCLFGSFFAGARFIDARGFQGTVVGVDHTGLLTGLLSLMLLILSIPFFALNEDPLRWLIGSGALILGALFLPAAIRWTLWPVLWIPVLGSFLILIAVCCTIRPAPSWWRPSQQHVSFIAQGFGRRLYGGLSGLGAVITLAVSATLWKRYADGGAWIGIEHNGLVTGGLSLCILLVSCSSFFIRDERVIRRVIGSSAIVLACLFLPNFITMLSNLWSDPSFIYAMVGCGVMLLGAASDVVFQR